MIRPSYSSQHPVFSPHPFRRLEGVSREPLRRARHLAKKLVKSRIGRHGLPSRGKPLLSRSARASSTPTSSAHLAARRRAYTAGIQAVATQRVAVVHLDEKRLPTRRNAEVDRTTGRRIGVGSVGFNDVIHHINIGPNVRVAAIVARSYKRAAPNEQSTLGGKIDGIAAICPVVIPARSVFDEISHVIRNNTESSFSFNGFTNKGRSRSVISPTEASRTLRPRKNARGFG